MSSIKKDINAIEKKFNIALRDINYSIENIEEITPRTAKDIVCAVNDADLLFYNMQGIAEFELENSENLENKIKVLEDNIENLLCYFEHKYVIKGDATLAKKIAYEFSSGDWDFLPNIDSGGTLIFFSKADLIKFKLAWR